jgi:branched-chain amino acid transport system permease protein
MSDERTSECEGDVDWVNAVVQGILLGGLYALYAAGLSFMFGVMRIVNLAHGDLAILAAFLAVVFADQAGLSPLVSLFVVVPIMFVAGYVLQRGVLNYSLRGGELGPLLATFGLSIVIQNALLEKFSADQRSLNAGNLGTSSIHVSAQVSIGWLPVITLALAGVVIFFLHELITRTQLGRAFRAASDDPEAASVVGIDQAHLYAVATGLAIASVATAGVLYGMRTSFGPSDGPGQLLFGFEAVIIGGLGNLRGTLVGGIVLGVAQTVGAQISPPNSILAGHLVVLAVLVIRPSGLLPRGVHA